MPIAGSGGSHVGFPGRPMDERKRQKLRWIVSRFNSGSVVCDPVADKAYGFYNPPITGREREELKAAPSACGRLAATEKRRGDRGRVCARRRIQWDLIGVQFSYATGKELVRAVSRR